ncbi:MAG: GAF domain-containing protein, partial [Cyanobacteria bacterium J06639_1]
MVSVSCNTEVECRQQEAIEVYRIPFQSAQPPLLQLVKLAALAFDAPIAALALTDSDIDPVSVGVARHTWTDGGAAIAFDQQDVQVIPDARLDREWSRHPLVNGSPYVRFCAIAPLRSPTGIIVGTLTVADRVPRSVSDDQLEALVTLGQQAIAQLELRRRSTVARYSPPSNQTVQTLERVAAPGIADRYLEALAIVQRQLLLDTDGNDIYGRVLELLGHVSGASRIY